MTNRQFAGFRGMVERATPADDLWWMGCWFMDLTPSQINRIFPLLADKFPVEPHPVNGKPSITLPSGLRITKQ